VEDERKMRVCPKCGFLDLEYWRQNRWRTNVDFTTPIRFKDDHPQLARDLEELANKIGIKKAVVTDKLSAYKYGAKKRVVERILLSEFKAAGLQAFRIPTEHPDSHTRDPNQRRLDEEIKP
jgi:hypothetical protein